jgi:hypothetical protein
MARPAFSLGDMESVSPEMQRSRRPISVHREIAEIKESKSLGSQGDRRDQGGKISWFNREIAEI